MILRTGSAASAVVSLVLSLLVVGVPVPASAATTTAGQLTSLLTVRADDTAHAYSRDYFRHWIDADGDGCDTRDEVLIAESTTQVDVGSGCAISGGTWVSPYDGASWTDPSDVDIDHMVPLAEAWRSGAWAWTAGQREAFANDLDVDYALVAVTDNVNQSKGDQDPANWMPPAAGYSCEYVTEWALIKYRYSLSIDQAEQSSLNDYLSGDCGARTVELPVRIATDEAPKQITFSDVTSSTAFATEIRWLAAQGISTGWELPDGRFEYRPLGRITRDAMAAFLYRMAGQPAYTPPSRSPFVDVATSNPFYKEIAWLASRGVSTGWSTARGAEFRPYANITRDAMAAFLYRYAGKPSYRAPSTSPFTDVKSGGTFYTEIAWLASKGISTGTSTGYGCRVYEPFSAVKRDAMAAFMFRYTNGGTTPASGSNCNPPAPKPSPAVGGTVTPGAFCAKDKSGWYGYTSAGTLMQCKTSVTDSRLRWRAA